MTFTPNFTNIGTHAQQMAKNCKDDRMQMILQWTAVGSVITMGMAAAVHMFKDLFPRDREHKYRELSDRLDRHYESRDRGR